MLIYVVIGDRSITLMSYKLLCYLIKENSLNLIYLLKYVCTSYKYINREVDQDGIKA